MSQETEPQVDLSEWDKIEDFSTHSVYIGSVDGVQLRCEIQIETDFLWIQLYDVSNSTVVNETQNTTDDTVWDIDRISEWIASSLAEQEE